MVDLGTLEYKYGEVQRSTTSARGYAVYRAVHRELGRPVAIEVLPRLSLEGTAHHQSLFQRGAKAAAGLQHQNIVQVLDYETTHTGNLLVTEWIEGEPLSAILQRDGRLSLDRAFDVAWQLSAALETAHQAGRIHRNLKPAEILISPRGQVKLGGFEAAVLPEAVADEWNQQRLFGNPIYVSPEQIQGSPVNERSDVYALGVLIYQMLTGQPPFTGPRPWTVLHNKITSDPAPPSRLRPELSAEVDAWVLKLLSRSPQDRWANMAEFRQSLKSISEPPADTEQGERDAIGRRYPFPIAISYVLIWRELEWTVRLNRLLDVFEAIVKYCSSVALFSAFQQTMQQMSADVRSTLRRPSLGHWVRYLDLSVRTALAGASPIREQLGQFYLGGPKGRRRCLDAINLGVHLRNRIRHGATQPDANYESAFQELLPHVETMLESLDFLTAYPLARVQRIQYSSGKFTIHYSSCMGALPAFPTAKALVKEPVEEGRLGILDAQQERFIDLTPLVEIRKCPICGDEEIFYYNGYRGKKRIELLSYHKGHQFDYPFEEDPFGVRGITW